ncbi:MAG: ribosome biogenesis GTPase Der, partial [Methyloceanibacter sp.]
SGSEGLTSRMREQTEAAVEQADLILFLIDARAGVIGADTMFAELVRNSGKPVVLAANKSEGRAAEAGFYEAFELGLGEPLVISAEHGIGIGEISDAIEQAFEEKASEAEGEDNAEEDEGPHALRIAIVGRPNVGKSTLVNALLGEERMITGPEAGITRDAIASEVEWAGRPLRVFDTAGLRRKMRVEGKAEELSVGDTLKAIRFAEVVILLLDAEQPFEKQDLQIASLIAQEGRALVIAVNKWDLVVERDKRRNELRERCQRLLPQVKGVAMLPVSAVSGRGLDKVMNAVLAADELWNRRIPTRALNQWLEAATDAHPPPAASGRRIRLRYMTQANARPPTFVVFCSQPKALPTSYSRYLVNGLRESFDLPGVPIRLNMRKGKNPYAKD